MVLTKRSAASGEENVQALVKHVLDYVRLRKEARKRGLGFRIDMKLCRLVKGPDGNKAYAINIQAQWDEERWVSVKCGPDGGGWRMADRKMRVIKCGWKNADGKMRMIKWA